jgi:hypothetical protein
MNNDLPDSYTHAARQCQQELRKLKELIKPLEAIGLIDTTGVRDSHVGSSDYSEHVIQPWSIWLDYTLNPWDADLVKRLLRTKAIEGMSTIDARILDYTKIQHISAERIRQLEIEKTKTQIELKLVDNL